MARVSWPSSASLNPQACRTQPRPPWPPCADYGWFTEGFDTLDLKEAKALLDELAT